jgi:HD-GYP domain-containing protein (c-di-GMP phosphodiesterase class II)
VGKIGVPDGILRKPGRLTVEEYDVVKQHPTLAEIIIREIPDLEEVCGAVVAHHERWDGAGYPHGLMGEGIPLIARILGIADAYSAMTSDRPYRKGMSPQEAVDELRACSGRQFDPALVEVFIATLNIVTTGNGQDVAVDAPEDAQADGLQDVLVGDAPDTESDHERAVSRAVATSGEDA